MRLECIAIGTELLTTARLDTNSVWLAERLAPLGLAFHRKTAVGDDPEDLKCLFAEALERSDWILCTGGLGPTFDDLTKEVWADLLGEPLQEDPEARAEMLAFYAARKREPSPNNFKQVLLPRSARRLSNPLGTAPGVLWIDPPGHPGRTVVLMPGVPREMKAMWEHQVEPLLAPYAAAPTHTLRLVTCMVPESTLDLRTQPLRETFGDLDWTILSSYTHVELQARSRDAARLAEASQAFVALLGEDLVCIGAGSVESTVLDLLQARGQTFAAAESMTGGQLAARFTALPGASDAFRGGAVVYSAPAKTHLADLAPECLDNHGTVSETTTAALAEGIRHKLATTWGVAITGNAGPGLDALGETAVGQTFLAVAGPTRTRTFAYHFPGVRTDVQVRAANWALDLLRREILNIQS